jgi:type IV secretory pathway TraG/TraD family ATPase VirD4
MRLRSRLLLWSVAYFFLPVPLLPSDLKKSLAWFCTPLVETLAPLWKLDSSKELVVATIVCWWAYALLAKWAVVVPCRFFGLDAPEWGRLFVRTSIPWRLPFKILIAPLNWWRRQMRTATGANAAWQSYKSVLAHYGSQYAGKGILFARNVWAGVRGLEALTYTGKLGVILFGQPGSGKTATFISWLGSLPKEASALYIDVAGEITQAVGGWLRETGHRLTVIDLSKGGGGGGVYNVFDELKAIEARANDEGRNGREAIVPAIKKIAEAIVVQQNDLQKTFDNRGRSIVASLIVFVYLWATEENKNLAYVRHLLAQGLPTDPAKPKETPSDVLLFEMGDLANSDDGCHGLLNELVRDGAVEIRNGRNREGGNPFLGSALAACEAWGYPAVVHSTSGKSSFLMADLRTGNDIVSIVASVGDIPSTYQPLIRLLFTMYEHLAETVKRSAPVPSVVIVDEAQNLGDLSLARGGPHMRKHNVLIALGAQDLPGLQACYPRNYESMLSAAGMLCFLPSTDQTTIEYIHKRLGRETVREKIEGTHWFVRLFTKKETHVRNRYQSLERDLMTTVQIAETLAPGHGRMIVLGEGRPFIAGVAEYWKVLPVSRYEAAGYGDSVGRALTRRAVPIVKEIKAKVIQLAEKFNGKMTEVMEAPPGYVAGAIMVCFFATSFAGSMLDDETAAWPIRYGTAVVAAIVAILSGGVVVAVPLMGAYVVRTSQSEGTFSGRHPFPPFLLLAILVGNAYIYGVSFVSKGIVVSFYGPKMEMAEEQGREQVKVIEQTLREEQYFAGALRTGRLVVWALPFVFAMILLMTLLVPLWLTYSFTYCLGLYLVGLVIFSEPMRHKGEALWTYARSFSRPRHA